MRLIGIDTPEVFGGLECGARQASASMKRLAPRGRRVRVFGDPTQARRDSFGRLLAYVKTKGGPQLNIAQVRRGWAKVFVFGGKPFRQTSSYRRAAKSAKRQDRGVWGQCGGNFHQRISQSVQTAKACGSFKKRITRDTTYVIRVRTKRVSCRSGRRMMKDFWFRRGRVRHGGPYTYNTYYTLKRFPGWKCFTGAGAGGCRKRSRRVDYSIPPPS